MDRFLVIAAAGGIYILDLFDSLLITLFGVPLPVIGMAAAGAMFSHGLNDSVKPKPKRKQLYFWVGATTFLSTVSVAVLPPMLGWEWVSPALQAPFAGFLGFSAQWTVPHIIKAMPKLVNKVFRLEDKTEDDFPRNHRGRWGNDNYYEDQDYDEIK